MDDGTVDGFVFSDEIRNSDYRVTGKMSEQTVIV